MQQQDEEKQNYETSGQSTNERVREMSGYVPCHPSMHYTSIYSTTVWVLCKCILRSSSTMMGLGSSEQVVRSCEKDGDAGCPSPAHGGSELVIFSKGMGNKEYRFGIWVKSCGKHVPPCFCSRWLLTCISAQCFLNSAFLRLFGFLLLDSKSRNRSPNKQSLRHQLSSFFFLKLTRDAAQKEKSCGDSFFICFSL